MSDLSPTVASWRDQIERVSEHASPCRYLTPTRWAAMRANALAFIDQHGAEAHRLGWTAPQLFGVHPEHGFLRVEYAGALMVNDTQQDLTCTQPAQHVGRRTPVMGRVPGGGVARR
ncbi:hypothetical protein ACLBXO_30495 [Methylobacterium sp. C33D]